MSEAQQCLVRKSPVVSRDHGIGNGIECIFTLRFNVFQRYRLFLSAGFTAGGLSTFRSILPAPTGEKFEILNSGADNRTRATTCSAVRNSYFWSEKFVESRISRVLPTKKKFFVDLVVADREGFQFERPMKDKVSCSLILG